jgi:hypothetical protein
VKLFAILLLATCALGQSAQLLSNCEAEHRAKKEALQNERWNAIERALSHKIKQGKKYVPDFEGRRQLDAQYVTKLNALDEKYQGKCDAIEKQIPVKP